MFIKRLKSSKQLAFIKNVFVFNAQNFYFKNIFRL